MWLPAMLTLVVAALLTIVALAAVFTRGEVSRSRLERFARREQLPITADNGNRVIRYLATTRRWRVAGFLVGLLLSQLAAPPEAIVHFNSVIVFFGWFLGALAAEARVAHLEYGSLRVASLQPRQPGRYVRRAVWALVPGAAVAVALTGAATVVARAVHWAEPDWWGAGWTLGGGLALAAVVRWVQHSVLNRAQPLAAPDLMRADDAMRSRSLHVLSGGGAAMVGFLWLTQLGALRAPGLAGQLLAGLQLVGVFVIALAGWAVATAPAPAAPARAVTS